MTTLRAWLMVEEPDETEPASFYHPGWRKWPVCDENYTRGSLGVTGGHGTPFLPPESASMVEVLAQLRG